MEPVSWHFYVVRMDGGALYAGIATDVERRLEEHRGRGRRGAKALRGRRSIELALTREIGEHGQALRVEHRFKRLAKSGKEALIEAAPGRVELLRRLGLMRAGPGPD